MVICLSQSVINKKLVEALHNNAIQYCGIMNDGRSSAKTIDDRELLLSKQPKQVTTIRLF